MADYTPMTGRLPENVDFTHGIIQSAHRGVPTTAGAAIARRLAMHRPGELSCYDQELLLPAGACDLLRGLPDLVRHYEAQLIPGQVDLLGITTVRFDHGCPCHEQWELARGFARQALNGRQLAVQVIHHVPGLAGRAHKPHLHLLYPVRLLHGACFGAFSELTKSDAKLTLASEWAGWLAANG